MSVSFGSSRHAQQVSMGTQHACALLDDASVRCWGQNSYGELGVGTTTNLTAPSGTGVPFQSGRSAIGIGAGNYVSCALLDNQNVTCWGLNTTGQLGLGDTTNRGDLPATQPSTYTGVSY